ncbi:MAG: sugar phosphate isomerase/epimerase [Prevotella sp.]|jgi:sugar phosphate isomerase/epimerase|nr:sugar phosphate isomerase/epimerase [Prevotella sp.]
MKTSIILTFAFLLLASGASKAQTAQDATPVKKDIALQLYSLRSDIAKDYDGTVQKAGDAGYTAVEAASYDDGKFYGKTPEEFKASIENAGMTVLSSHTGKGLSDTELATKDFSESLKWWDRCIAAHKAAGMKYIVTPSMPVPKTLKDLQTYCEYYNEIGKRCKENGMSYGYHNHSYEFVKIEDKVMYDYMLENTDPEYVFFEMDVYWAIRGGQSPVDYFNKYKNRFTLLHIKDNKELGQSGMVGFDAIFKNTDAAGTKHLIVEVEQYNFTPIESVKKSLEYLQNCPLVKESYDK